VLTTAILLAEMLAIGFFARSYSRRTRLLIACGIVIGIILLMRG
jgi:hypothetical protein